MKGYSDQHWEGSFEDYLDRVRKNPKVTRTAFQRVYDMVLSHGKTEYIDNKKKLVSYDFFTDPDFGAKDAIYGLDIALMKLVNVFKSAAQGYGTEKRVILLHGPVGSSKSTIARLLKKGLEAYSKTPEGALYTFSWDPERTGLDGQRRREVMPCPMHEEPLHLVPQEWRARVYGELAPPGSGFTIADTGDLCPALPLRLPGAHDRVQGRLVAGHGARQGAPAHPLGEGPDRHRHLPAQGREEPGLHRADRRQSTTARSPSTAPTPTRAPSTSTASSTSPTAASSSSWRS